MVEVTAAQLRAVREEFGVDHPLTRAMLQARVATVTAQERVNPSLPEGWLWWLSFVDEEKGFLGVAVVEADGPATAMDKTTELGINPGGAIGSYPVPGEHVAPAFRDRLLTRADVD